MTSRIVTRLFGRSAESSDELLRSFEQRLARSYNSEVTLNHSIARLTSRAAERTAAIAVATCLPPAETGIATASMESFRNAPFAVDAFASYETAADYFAAIGDLRLRGSNMRCFDLACMPLALGEIEYGAQVYVVGNSDHNLPVVAALRRTRMFPPQAPIWVYLHDLCLLNILEKWCRSVALKFDTLTMSCYGKRPAKLFQSGAFGIKALLHDLPITGIIVNSQAAREFVIREMPNARVEVLFHPVIDVGRAIRPRKGPLRIGTFGVPCGPKRTEVILKAFEMLKRRTHPNARLVIAGYYAANYARSHRLRPGDGYEIYDTLGDEALHDLMAGVDVAVQLRKENLGESSGVIARLLAMGIPTVASPVGAFAEYGDAVAMLGPAEGAARLADLIQVEAQRPSHRAAAMAAYAHEHTPSRFCTRLMHLFGMQMVAPHRVVR